MRVKLYGRELIVTEVRAGENYKDDVMYFRDPHKRGPRQESYMKVYLFRRLLEEGKAEEL